MWLNFIEPWQRMEEEKCNKTPVDSPLCKNEVNRCKDGFQNSHRNSQGSQDKTGHSYESEKVQEQKATSPIKEQSFYDNFLEDIEEHIKAILR